MKRTLLAAAVVAVLALTGCSGQGGSSSGTVKIGASIPLTGSLAAFGKLLKLGYQDAVDDVNRDGGVTIDGTKRKVQLVVNDSKSDPQAVSDQSRTLILDDGVVALLGSVSPPLTIPASNVADRQHVPFVTSLTPLEAWKAGNSSGWKYAWDFFFDEKQMTDLQFNASNLVSTNKKIALFTDTEEDGITMGKLWQSKAAKFGYSIASHASFPVGTTDYSSFIANAKDSGAQVLIAQMLPPDAFALWKQMKAAAYTPKVVFCEKCAAQGAFQQALGTLADGTLTTDFRTTSSDAKGKELLDEYTPTYGENVDVSSIIAGYTAAKIVTDAISRAGSDDPEKINDAIGKTSGLYPIGVKIAFGSDHTSALTPETVQWEGTSAKKVYPTGGDAVALQSPPAGLK